MLDRKLSEKLLQDFHTDGIHTLKKFKLEHPAVHWCELKYSKTGDTILHAAARLRRTEAADFLLNNWMPKIVDHPNNDGKMALHESAQFSQPDIVGLLLQHGSNVNPVKRADWTPLMFACTKSGTAAYEVVECLLENGALVNPVNKDGWSALHIAARTGDSQIFELLLNRGAKIGKTKNGRTVLHIACLHGCLNIVNIILDKKLCAIDEQDSCGNVAVHESVLSNCTDLVDIVKGNGGDLYAANKVGLTCLHMAAGMSLNQMIKYLIVNLKLSPDIKTDDNVTPLHCAARKKNTESFELLIKLGADTTIRDNHGRLAIDYLNL